MTDTLKKYWELRLSEVKNVLEENNFQAFVADSIEEPRDNLTVVVNAPDCRRTKIGGTLGTSNHQAMLDV